MKIKLSPECSIVELVDFVVKIKKEKEKFFKNHEVFELYIDFESLVLFDAATLQFIMMLQKNIRGENLILSFLNVSKEQEYLAKRWGASSLF